MGYSWVWYNSGPGTGARISSGSPAGSHGKDQTVTRPEAGLPQGTADLGGEEEETFFVRSFEKFVQIGPVTDPYLGPVIQASAFEAAITGTEAQGMNQVQGRVRGPAQGGHGPGWGISGSPGPC